jgi:hypothetical protein
VKVVTNGSVTELEGLLGDHRLLLLRQLELVGEQVVDALLPRKRRNREALGSSALELIGRRLLERVSAALPGAVEVLRRLQRLVDRVQ